MRYFTSFCWLAAIGAAGVVHAQTFRTDINPALTYYQAFNTAPDLPRGDSDFLFTNEWRGQKLPDRFGELVSRYDNEFRLMSQAAQSKAACDWGVDFSAGPDTLLGHLARAKTAANVARLRAMWDLQHDRQADARKDLLNALALGRQVSHDGCLISVLVQFAMERIVCETIAENYNHFTPEIFGELANGLSAPPARGTIANAIPMEKTFARWFVDRTQELQAGNPGNDARVMEGLRQIFEHAMTSGDSPDTNSSWAQVMAASGGTSDGVIKLLRDMDPLYDRLQTVETLPLAQYEEQMPPLSAEIDNSTNPFVRELFPALQKLRPREFSAMADLAMTQAAVQYKLNGQAGFNSVANPIGQGPFAMQRFVFDNAGRGFELSADYAGLGYPEVFIFIEKDGPPFLVFGKNAGKAPAP
ncbi:MAG TPA: hypothetical protein VGO59_05425 [Verrucomicrobiae bacterium]|jgi:hypothetical protein